MPPPPALKAPINYSSQNGNACKDSYDDRNLLWAHVVLCISVPCFVLVGGMAPLRSRGGAFSFRHYPTCRGDTVRAFAATRGSAEIAAALSLAAVRVCVIGLTTLPPMPHL